jgi:hypothetical protein
MPKPYGPDTLVAEAIADDPAVVARLVALNPTFRKLKNPVLRRVMARLVNFRDAARVAGVPLDDMLAAANGAATGRAAEHPARPAPGPQPRPKWVGTVDLDSPTRFDARPLLARDEEPLGPVMRLAAKIREGGDLVVDAPFDPAPLRRVLRGKGFVSYSECLGAEHWRVFFRRDAALSAAAGDDEPVVRDGATSWREDGIAHIDVRGLEPPQPMVAILALIEAEGTGDTVIVHHEREPLFLYPELDERGWGHEMIAGDPGEVRLRLTRGDA